MPKQQADYAVYLMAMRQIFRHLPLAGRDDLLVRIQQSKTPILGIFGDKDAVISIESAILLLNLLPRARVEILAGGTHQLPIHRWQDVSDLMLSFLCNNCLAKESDSGRLDPIEAENSTIDGFGRAC